MSPTSFLGRFDIWTQRVREWIGAFPRWHGGTWATPPEQLDRYGVPISATYEELKRLNGPMRMVEGPIREHFSQGNRVVETAERLGLLDPGSPTDVSGRATVTEINEEESTVTLETPLAEKRIGLGGQGRPLDSPILAGVAAKIDPRIIEADRQEHLPPHAKGLEQNPNKLPPGKGKGQGRPFQHRDEKRTGSQWPGRLCGTCKRRSGGPRSVHCQHCFEPFK